MVTRPDIGVQGLVTETWTMIGLGRRAPFRPQYRVRWGWKVAPAAFSARNKEFPGLAQISMLAKTM